MRIAGNGKYNSVSLVWILIFVLFWGVGVCLVWCCFVLSVVEDYLELYLA